MTREFVDSARVSTYQIPMFRTRLDNGSTRTHDEATDLNFYIAGLHDKIQCVVEHSPMKHDPTLLGMTELGDFRCGRNATYGLYREWKVTVAKDAEGHRQQLIIVPQDF